MKIGFRMLLSVALAAMLVPVAWTQSTATGRYDQDIQARVAKLLNSGKWKDVTATTEDGVVTLQGKVKLYIDKADLAKKVEKIEHVESVRNHVEVDTTVPDAELYQKLADKLAYDRIGQGITFNALTLQVQNGVATVGGDVHDYPSRDSALAIVETTPGVKDVIDNINVLPTSGFDDDLRIRIARAIYGFPTMKKYAIDPQRPIRIIVDNGHVTLYGVVDSKMDSQIAETQARTVSGSFSVENKLVIAHQGK